MGKPLEPMQLRQLDGIKMRREPWVKVAEMLRAGFYALQGPSADIHASFLLAAAEASGYTPNMLGRYVQALCFIEAEAKAGRAPFAALAQAPFAVVETLRKISTVDPAAGAKLVERTAKQGLSLKEATTAYEQVSSAEAGRVLPSRRTGTRHRLLTESQTLSALLEQLPLFTGVDDAQVSQLPPPLDFIRIDLIAFRLGRRQGNFIDGFEIKFFPDRVAQAAIDDTVARTALASTFYRRTWLLLARQSEHVFSRVQWMLKNLGLSWIGVAALDNDTGKLDQLIIPKGTPVPDRRAQMHAALLKRL